MRIHGVNYKCNAVVRVKYMEDMHPSVYGLIREVIVYEDLKVFMLDLLQVICGVQHIGAIEVKNTGQIGICLHSDLYSQSITEKK